MSLGTREPVSVSSLRQKLSVLKRRHADKLGKSYRACPKVHCKSLPAREACENAPEFMGGTGGRNSSEVTLNAVPLDPLVLGSGTRVVGPAAASPVRAQTGGCESHLFDRKAGRHGRDCTGRAESSSSFRDVAARRVTGLEKNSPSRDDNFKKFLGFGHSELLIIEICAGTAALSKCAKQHGFRTLPIDRSKIRSKGSDILVMDLADHAPASCLKEIIATEASRTLAVFAAPPCGARVSCA